MKLNRKYKSPTLKAIQIDKEISLALASPPCGPGECNNELPNNLSNNPYKNMG
jgi:hypothetical protein